MHGGYIAVIAGSDILVLANLGGQSFRGLLPCSSYIHHSKVPSKMWQPAVCPKNVEVKGRWEAVDRFLPRAYPGRLVQPLHPDRESTQQYGLFAKSG